MIEREEIRFVAAADWTDDCRVKIWLRKRVTKLTIAEAKALRYELDVAIAEASIGADDLRHEHEPAAFDLATLERHIHPECVAGKCGNCDGQTLTITDEWVPCAHHCHGRTGA